jgi:formylglycine-generating enzyme
MIKKRFVFMLFVVLGTMFCFVSSSMADDVVQETFTSPSLGAKFNLIPAGTFMMGSPSNEPARGIDEIEHQVTISKPFYMQTTELTQAQWKVIMKSDPTEKPKGFWNKIKGTKPIICDECPVGSVSWIDVQDFIRKLNRQEGTDKYRLPTEAEWEYAARAGTTTTFYTGDCLNTDQANYNGNYPLTGCSKGEFREKSLPVGTFAPNAWGLYNMSDNVWEWVYDWYGPYTSDSVTDPEGAVTGSGRIVRGGSWYDGAGFCRSAARSYYGPEIRDAILGFRLLRVQ